MICLTASSSAASNWAAANWLRRAYHLQAARASDNARRSKLSIGPVVIGIVRDQTPGLRPGDARCGALSKLLYPLADLLVPGCLRVVIDRFEALQNLHGQ